MKPTSTIAKINYPKNDNPSPSSSIYSPSLVKLISNDADKTEKDLARQETETSIKSLAAIQERDLHSVNHGRTARAGTIFDDLLLRQPILK